MAREFPSGSSSGHFCTIYGAMILGYGDIRMTMQLVGRTAERVVLWPKSVMRPGLVAVGSLSWRLGLWKKNLDAGHPDGIRFRPGRNG
jgi:hypothetical protein